GVQVVPRVRGKGGGAPRQRAFNRTGVGHLADGGLDPVNAERIERGRDLLRRSCQDPDSVPGSHQRRDRVGADISRPPGYQNEQCSAPPDVLQVNAPSDRAGPHYAGPLTRSLSVGPNSAATT